jgi:hypothetical protein
MSKQTVLITSALYTNYGIYDHTERLAQTIATAESARKYIPDSTVILIDNSKPDIQMDESDEFESLLDLVDFYIDNSHDPDIQYFHNNVSNYDIGKNSMEVIGFIKALDYIRNSEELFALVNETNRVFKLSGRYELTDKFDISRFDNDDTKDKYVFKKAQDAWCDYSVTNVEQLLQTRLWSFTPSLFDETLEMFKAILANMLDTYNKQQYIDIEHSIYRFIDHTKLVQLDTVGIKGNIAPNGMIILE